MFPLHMRQTVSASSASVAEPTTAAGKLYAGATLIADGRDGECFERGPRSAQPVGQTVGVHHSVKLSGAHGAHAAVQCAGKAQRHAVQVGTCS